MRAVAVLATNRQKNLTNAHPRTNTLWFPKSTPHTSLKPISSCTWKHLIDAQDMERMHPDSQMECIFPSKFGHIFVASNTCSLKSFTWNILFFPRDQMNTEGELIHSFLFHSYIVNPDLGVRYTTAIPWFWVWLVLDLAITPSRSCKRTSLTAIKS